MKALFAAAAILAGAAAPARADPPPASAFATQPVVRTVAISSDGQHLAIAGRADGQATIRFVTVDKSEITVAKLSDVVVTQLRWLDDNRVYAEVEFPVKVSRGYITLRRVVVVSARDGRSVTMLADNKTTSRLLRHNVSGVTPDNHLLMFGYPVSLPTVVAYPALLRVDPTTGVGEPIKQGVGATTGWLVDRSGVIRGEVVNEKDGNFSIHAASDKAGAGAEIWRTTGEDDRKRYHGYSAADDAIMVSEPGPQGDQLVLKHLGGGADTPLGKPHKTDPVQWVWDAKSGSLVGRGFGAGQPGWNGCKPILEACRRLSRSSSRPQRFS